MRHQIARIYAPCAVVLGLALGTQSAAAQPARAGPWLSAGIGSGSVGVDCSDCPSDRESGLALMVRGGGTLNERWRLGGEVGRWSKSEDGLDGQVITILAIAQFYPVARGNFFVLGGGGLSRLKLDDGVDEIKSNGIAAQVGAGYDIRLYRGLAITPYASYMHSFGGDAKLNGTDVGERLNPNFFQVGLGLSWH